jgi:outer membrane protein, multidrug efflux system
MNHRHLIPIAALALCSCTVGPDFQLPGFSGGSRWKETQTTTATHLPDHWWRLFNDRELTRLIDRALAANNDLAAAKARFDTARALVGVDRARMFPALNLNGSAGESRMSEGAASQNIPPGAVIDLDSQRYRGTFDLSYDPDLWGRNKRLLEASSAQAAQAGALLDSQRLGIATEVARQYFLLCGLDAQKSVLEETISSRQSTFDLQKSKADAGLIDGLSTSQARTELELAKNDIALVERQRGSAEHALAVLCGTRPSDFSIAHRGNSGTLPSIRPGLPAEVLNRRPDVRAAEQNLRATNARVLAIGAGVAAPVFDGGSNRANFDAAVANRDEALANYRNTLLVALREVEDTLVDLKGLAASRNALEQALASARDTRRISQERYDKGLSSYLEVVEAGRTVLRVELVLAQIQSQQRISLAALAKALGGGWSGRSSK